MKLFTATILIAAALGLAIEAQSDPPPRMQAWARALGVGCDHCHVPDDWSADVKAPFAFARRMQRMVDGVNTRVLQSIGEVTCWTCHRGATRPPRLPRAAWEAFQTRYAGVFSGYPEPVAIRMSVYAASLGVDCEHCHLPDRWADAGKAAHATVATMSRLFDEIPRHFETARLPLLQCYMCHQGHIRPE